MLNTLKMPRTPSIMSLHLRYRLWIAEMNSDITILRIFDDYLNDIAIKNHEPEVKEKMDYFQRQFINLRKDIDSLRHEMHLLKMKLAAYSKQSQPIDHKTYQSDNHTTLKKLYLAFRKFFNKIKDEFTLFEGEILS
jgi:hypothetical protein